MILKSRPKILPGSRTPESKPTDVLLTYVRGGRWFQRTSAGRMKPLLDRLGGRILDLLGERNHRRAGGRERRAIVAGAFPGLLELLARLAELALRAGELALR